jgi:phosphate acetyltransferase/phosphate butyryltransferase
MEKIENKLYNEVNIGDSATLVRRVTPENIQLFSKISGGDKYARQGEHHRMITHGMWSIAAISTIITTRLPGPGSIIIRRNLRFNHPIAAGDRISIVVQVIDKDTIDESAIMHCQCINQDNQLVVSGEIEAKIPTEKVKRPRIVVPQLSGDKKKYYSLIDQARGLPPVRMAVVHPVDRNSLIGAVDAALAGLIEPVLVGPEARIKAVAASHNLDISNYTIVPTEHSHQSAAKAVALARAGEVGALLKGSLHTDELLHEVLLKETGISTGRRLSHVFVVDVPTYPRHLLITDAAINIYPNLDIKRDIVQNAIDLAHVLGIECPKVAILSSIETVNSDITSTTDAASLCKMADRNQITGGIIDGPLAFDNVISAEAAKIKGIVSPVSGEADILLAPDLESGNMIAKQLEYLAHAHIAGIVVGARVPLAVTSRADKPLSRMASCAIALLMAHYKK